MSPTATPAAGRDVWADRTPRKWQADAFDKVRGMVADRRLRKPLIQACTGSGKSILIGAFAAAAKRGPILITTPTQALVEQLSATVAHHVGAERVGRCFQHAWEPDRHVVVTCNPSLPRLLDERPGWALWIADEAHRLEGESTREVRTLADVPYAIGFTATPFRSDEKGLEMWDRLAYQYSSHDAVRDGVLVPFRVVRAEESADVNVLTRQWVAEAEGPGIVSALTVDDAEGFAASIPHAEAIHSYMPRDEQQRRIEALRTGELKCLVHVALLTEGIDLPWLHWLVMRRPVRSPVRLVQEVGRVLRTHPGKDEAVLYDPHDLLGAIGLVHAAELDDCQKKGDPPERELTATGREQDMPYAVAIDPLDGWVTDMLGVLRGAQLAKPADARFPTDAEWRHEPASGKQVTLLRRWLDGRSWCTRALPPKHRDAIRKAARNPGIKRGTASEVIDILAALGRCQTGLDEESLPPVPDCRRRRPRRSAS